MRIKVASRRRATSSSLKGTDSELAIIIVQP
jgi:hypothetical protein